MKAITILFPVFFMMGLGLLSRLRGWISPEQKQGANAIVFNILFPILIFNLMMTVETQASSFVIVGYVFLIFLLAMVVGRAACAFTGREYQHFSWLLMTTTEGGSVALPLYLSIVGSSSNTVLFDIAGSVICFIVLPILVTRLTSQGASVGNLIKNIFTNSFVLSVLLGLLLNFTGLGSALLAGPIGELYTRTVSQATAPIVGLILFILGYDLTIDRSTVKPILKLMVVRILFYLLVIGGFFLLFPRVMQDKIFLMAVLIYFMSPPGFGLFPVIAPVYRRKEDAGFASAFVSLYLCVTLIVYAGVVILVA